MRLKITTEEFIERARETHGDIYDYSLVDYKGNKIKVKIICKKHGMFEQVPYAHISNKSGCPKCKFEKSSEIQRLSTEEFIEKARETHGDIYDYSLVDYINAKTKIKIICKKHGIFEQIPDNHIRKHYGCPKYNSSHGEERIRKFLIENNISFEEQKKFNTCKYKQSLPFDFYLSNLNLLIEYQGEQHYEPLNFSNRSSRFEGIKLNDKIKKEYCKNNNIPLLEICYSDFKNLENIIQEAIDNL